MSRSSDADHFFQTTQSLEEVTRRARKSKNEDGQPIRLKSKILALVPDPVSNGAVYLGDSAGQARRMIVDTGDSTHIYKGPSAPVTCLAISTDGQLLFAGCWDKTIWSWSTSNAHPQKRYRGHTDFVKAVVCAQVCPAQGHDPKQVEILISGSADTTIIVWDTKTGTKLHVLKGHNRGVLCLAVDPLSLQPLGWEEHSEEASTESIAHHLVLLSGASDREILEWHIPTSTLSPSGQSSTSIVAPLSPALIIHETSVNTLHFSSTDPPDLWTASADTVAKGLSHPISKQTSDSPVPRDRQQICRFDADDVHTTLLHDSINQLRTLTTDALTNTVITGGRNENVRVIDAATCNVICEFTGHFDEITGLAIITGAEDHTYPPISPLSSKPDASPLDLIADKYLSEERNAERSADTKKTRYLISVSLDGTIRRWNFMPSEIAQERRRAKNAAMDEAQDENYIDLMVSDDDSDMGAAPRRSRGKGKSEKSREAPAPSPQGKDKAGAGAGAGIMTEEEEKELDDLMADDDD